MSYTVVRVKRRVGGVVLAASLASAMPLFLADAHAGADEPGQGFAFAQGWKVDPKAGGLSIGIAFGQSTATHQNQVGRAVSTSTNFGVVGLTLGATQCDGGDPTWPLDDQPQPLIVDSRDTGAAQGKTETDWGQEGTSNGPFTKNGVATGDPFAKATTTILAGGQSGSGSSFEMGTALVTSSSGLVKGVREARATVELDFLNAAGPPGSVRMAGLRWDALHRSTDKVGEGHFTIGSVAFNNGPPMEGLKDKNATAALNGANAILGSLGLKLVPGEIHTSKDGARVDPLALLVVPNPLRDSATQTVLGLEVGDQEPYKVVRKAVTDAILQAGFPQDFSQTRQDDRRSGCRAGTYISVADIVTGSVTGAGEFVLSLGGVEVSTGESPKNSFNLDLGQFGTIGGLDIPGEPPLESSFIGTPDIVDGPAFPVAALPTSPDTSTTVTTTQTRLAAPAGSSRPPRPFEGNRGGALAAVGLVALGVLALVAEGDRRAMRRTLLEPR